jgi:hypothetical protein
MSLKILLCKFVAFFSGQIVVKGHKNIINSFQKLIISPKRFIGAHGGIKSQSARIVNTNHHIIMAVEFRLIESHPGLFVPQPTEWQHFEN